jgi:hypothetical protein
MFSFFFFLMFFQAFAILMESFTVSAEPTGRLEPSIASG